MKKTKGEFALIMTTAPDQLTALELGKSIVRKRLAACCNILPRATSIYWWKDKLEISDEVVLLLKTTRDKSESLKKELKKLHPYELPEILVFNPSEGSRKYLQWIIDSTRKSPAPTKNVAAKL